MGGLLFNLFVTAPKNKENSKADKISNFINSIIE